MIQTYSSHCSGARSPSGTSKEGAGNSKEDDGTSKGDGQTHDVFATKAKISETHGITKEENDQISTVFDLV